ncbi:MAG: adenylate kinase [Bacteroidetes bacterium]|uniref:Adenylate kinase n=1 Tax=Candidatus Caccoplasma merdipullorum TaxID=2840718 RepID=A0A9D9H7R6_9BACT|nr:adenylate kinase [Candidatus Caccoplasma merdipullorum]
MEKLNIVIFGAPGSGKGTQSEKLIEKYGLTHISTGDVLRKEIKNGSKLGKIAEEYISKGQLLPDELIVNILADTLDKCEIVKGVIFDGFPRTIPQAEALKKVLSERNMDISVVLGLEVEEKELIDRLLKRGAISGRSDDNIETINKRLEVYHSQTDPLREYYINEGKYKPITGDGTIDEIFEKIKKVIALL